MAFVITRLCRDCVDSSCVPVCPVPDCIVEHRPPPGAAALPNQLFINPDACIDCGACEPECPWEAICEEGDVPAAFDDDVALNAITAARAHRSSSRGPSASGPDRAKPKSSETDGAGYRQSMSRNPASRDRGSNGVAYPT